LLGVGEANLVFGEIRPSLRGIEFDLHRVIMHIVCILSSAGGCSGLGRRLTCQVTGRRGWRSRAEGGPVDRRVSLRAFAHGDGHPCRREAGHSCGTGSPAPAP